MCLQPISFGYSVLEYLQNALAPLLLVSLAEFVSYNNYEDFWLFKF